MKRQVRMLDKLTPKQQRFIEEYIIDFNGSAALLRAGYKSKNPDVDASQLLVKPSIKAEVEKRRAEMTKQAGITTEYVLNSIKNIADKDEAKDSDRLKALELLGKNLQLFTDVTKQVLPEGMEEIQAMVIRFKSMDTNELRKILNEGGLK